METKTLTEDVVGAEDAAMLSYISKLEFENNLIPLPTPVNCKKKKIEVVEVIQHASGAITTVYKYKTTNYGYTYITKDQVETVNESKVN